MTDIDYTTVQRVKDEIHAKATADDALLALLVTAASRAWDRKCTGVPDAHNYFATETIVGEVLAGQIDREGTIYCYPHKPIITSVSAFGYRRNPVEQTFTVDAVRTWADGPKVLAYPENLYFPAAWGVPYPHNLFMPMPSKCQVIISYTGGLGLTTADMPADMQELVTIIAARFYREAEGNLADTIGVAELGTMIYTKAWPVRVIEQMQPYVRKSGWRHGS